MFAYSHLDAYNVGFKRDFAKQAPIAHSLPFILAGMLGMIGITWGESMIGPVFTGLGGYLLGTAVGVILLRIIKVG